MKRRLTMRLTFSPTEVLEALKAKHPEIPPEATIKVTWRPAGATKEAEVVVSFDLPTPEQAR